MTEEKLAQIRANAALALEEFRDLSEIDFGYNAESVAWVEGFVERTRARYARGEVPEGIIAVIGSYLGEAIIAATGGKWVEDDAGGIGVRFANGDTSYPFAKVRKQFAQGIADGESIASFYMVSVRFVAAGKLGQTAGGAA